MKTDIRPLTRPDKPAVMRLLHRIPEFKAAEVAVAEEVIDSYLADPTGGGYHALVTEAGPTLTGYICHGPTPLTEGTWDIYWVAVAPDWQGQGIGGALLDAAEKEIARAEGRLAIVETSSTPAYEKTVRFYLGHGYEIIARLPDFYAPGDDKLILQKRLRG